MRSASDEPHSATVQLDQFEHDYNYHHHLRNAPHSIDRLDEQQPLTSSPVIVSLSTQSNGNGAESAHVSVSVTELDHPSPNSPPETDLISPPPFSVPVPTTKVMSTGPTVPPVVSTESHSSLPTPSPVLEARTSEPTSPQLETPPAHYHEVFQPIPHSSLGIKQRETDSGEGSAGARDKMLFGNLQKPILAHRRRVLATSNALTPYEADLKSKDRTKQKEAVKRYLAERVRTDWSWQWPQPQKAEQAREQEEELDSPEDEDQSSTPKDNASASNTSGAPEEWRERGVWLSELGESENEHYSNGPMTIPQSTFSDYPEQKVFPVDKKQQRREQELDELGWNDGLKCYTQRRNAWTAARPIAPQSATSSDTTPCDACKSHSSDSTNVDRIRPDPDIDVQIPVAPPLLPPGNPMRASIGPSTYPTIYDKVVLQGLTPACPINLSDVMSACVQGWKRDGEWPPKPTAAEPSISARKAAAASNRRKLSLSGILGLEKDKSKDTSSQKVLTSPSPMDVTTSANSSATATATANKNTLRRSLQKVFSLGHGAVPTAKTGEETVN